jgi:hypothetical protein
MVYCRLDGVAKAVVGCEYVAVTVAASESLYFDVLSFAVTVTVYSVASSASL